MTQSVVGALRVNLGLDSAQFSKGLKQAQSDLQRVGRQMQQIGAAISVVGAGIAVAVRGQINAADDLAKTADRIGIPVEALSQLDYAAKLSGVSLADLRTGLQQMARQVVENEEKFTELGIAVRDSAGNVRPIMDIFRDVSDQFAALPEGAERTAMAMELFGRSGANMAPLLKNGAEGIADLMAEADALGLTLTEETGRAAEAFNDNLTRLGSVVTGLARQMAAALLPVLVEVTDFVAGVAAAFADLSPQMQTAAVAIAGITTVVGPLLVVLGTLVRSLQAVGVAMAVATGPIGIAVTLLGVGAAAWLLFRSEAEKTPQPIDEAKVALNLLNEAMGTFSTSAGPKAQASALNTATALRDQAAAAIQAAEAELALMEAELARQTAAPLEQRGLMGDLVDQNLADDIAFAQAEIESLRASLDLARVRIRQAAGEITSQMNPALGESAEVAAQLDSILDSLNDEVGTLGSSAGRAATQDLPALADAMTEVQAAGLDLGDSLSQVFTDALTGARSLSEGLGQLAAQLADVLLNNAFQSLLGGIFGNTSLLGGLLSFDGGGYTGSGARSGGLDGKGGFVAMLHPNETVIDHTRGQGGGTVDVRVFVDDDGKLGAIAEQRGAAAGARTAVAVAQQQASGIGSIITDFQRRKA